MKSLDLRKITFGMTSAIITGIAIVGALFENPTGKMYAITSLLVFAIADNIADTFGIHMYQDAECMKEKEVWLSTIFNYLARLSVSLFFIGIIIVVPSHLASIVCVVTGFILLIVISYVIALQKKRKPFPMIVEHVALAAAVLFLSSEVGKHLRSLMK
jgi:VIT1/CCC1 family predicted Fe2+/Mn2+ transporter